MPDGIDQSWSFADPAAAKRAGVRVVSGYLSWDPSKNLNKSDVLAYHGVGIAVLMNWESQAGAPLNGANQGRLDATEAVRQANALVGAVGYRPGSKLVIIFSCDRDTNSSQYGVIDAYYRAAGAICHAAGYLVGVYGEADLVGHLSRAGITDVEWQTYAWSGGRVDPTTDFYQYNNGQRIGGASVDFDQIIHPDALGAWWPPGHALPSQPAPADPLEEIMAMYADKPAFEAAVRAIVRDEATRANQRVPVIVNGLLDYAHKGYASLEGFLSGIPGYVALHNRGKK